MDVLYLLTEDWVTVGHYFGGNPRWSLGELTMHPVPDDVAVAVQRSQVSPWPAGGPASSPTLAGGVEGQFDGNFGTWEWPRTADGLASAQPPEIYARMFRDVPFEDMRRAATAAANGLIGVGQDMREIERLGLANGTDNARWIHLADELTGQAGDVRLTKAQRTYLLTAALFEKHQAAAQVRFKIAKELAMTTDLVAGLSREQSQAKVRGWLDGARRLGYLTTHGAGRTAGTLTPLGRTLVAANFPEVLTEAAGR